MASKTLLFLTLFASTVSVILSIPQLQLAVQPQQNAGLSNANPEAPANPNVLDADNVPQYNPQGRTFNQLLNLSAYLQNAPNDSAAVNFVPLITLLSALG